MANIYVKSGAAGAANGTSWTDAYTTLLAAIAAAAAGDSIWVSNNHSEAPSSNTSYTIAGTVGSPVYITCVLDTQSAPFAETHRRTTAVIGATGNTVLSFNGYAEIYGIAITAGTGSGTATINVGNSSSSGIKFNRCTLNIGSSGSGGRLSFSIGPTGSGQFMRSELVDTTMQFAHASQSIVVRNGRINWRSTDSNLYSKVAGTTPTTLFIAGTGTPCGAEIVCDGVDLSPITGTLVGAIPACQRYIFRNCKVNASLTAFAARQTESAGALVESYDCDSGTTKGKHGRHGLYAGDLTTDFAVYRDSGATLDGSTHYSWKLVSTANAKDFTPLRTIELTKRNTTVGSPISPVAEILNDGLDLTTAEVFVDWYYMGASANVATYVGTTYAGRLDASGAPAITTSTESWTNGLSTPKPQKMSATFTPQEAGLIRAVVHLLRASTTLYVDPNM